ncbi:MAG: RCC1 domain-containing protein [Kofleriaceae bacterium]
MALFVSACGAVGEMPRDDAPLMDDAAVPMEDAAADADAAPPAPEPVEVSVSGMNGSNHSCARISNGRVFCWGANTIGQTGFAPAPLDSVGPGEVMLPAGTQPAGLVVAKSVQSDLIAFSCVLGADGKAHCWGSNSAGELGRGTFDSLAHPQPLAVVDSVGDALTGITGVALGGRYGCALVGTQVRCWGTDIGCAATGNADAEGQCLTTSGSILTRPVAVANVPASSEIATGAATTCAVAVTGDGVTCWGNNKYAASGNPAVTTQQDFPPTSVALTGVTQISQIVLGSAHACVVAAGRVHCWGQNNAGQIGTTGINGNVAAPFELTALAGHTHLTAGGFNVCAYTPSDPSGALVCLGANTNGQLGTGAADFDDHPMPASVTNLTDIASASIGGSHACAVARLRTDPAGAPRRVFCWGKNTAGQVTQPPSPNVLAPVEIALPL